MEGSQHAGGSHFENAALVINSTAGGCAVEVPISALHQAGLRGDAVRSVEGNNRSEISLRIELENRAQFVGASFAGNAIEISIRGFGQSHRLAAIRIDKIVQCR